MTTTPDHILELFRREAAEQVESLGGLLLRLEAAPRDEELMAQCLRTAHNLKGGAGTAEQNAIADVAHVVEDVVQGLRRGTVAPDGAVFDALLAALDAVEASLEELPAAGNVPEPLAAVRARLLALAAPAATPTAAAAPALAGFTLGEYDHLRLKVLARQGKQPLVVTATPPDAPGDLTTWAFTVIAALREHAAVVAFTPAEAELGTLGAGRPLVVLCGSGASAAELEVALAAAPHGRLVVAPAAPAAAAPGAAERGAAEPAAPVAAPAAPAAPGRPLGTAIRVDLARVDGLVDLIGELVVAHSMVAGAPEIAAARSATTLRNLGRLTQITRDLQSQGLRLRMVPLQETFQLLARTVRDVARRCDREVRLVTAGEELEIDRGVLAQLVDPLVHLVRNAVDHGVEPAAERVAAGKSRAATVRVSAQHLGGAIVVEVSDDGRGLDRHAIRRRAEAQGLLRADAAASDQEVLSCIFASGLSTAPEVTEVSGRGVGLDVVKRNVEAMRGRITITSTPGQGTAIRLTVPLTLTIIDGMLIACGRERYVVPTTAILESVHLRPGMVATVGRRWGMLNLRGSMLPLVLLGRLLGVPGSDASFGAGLVVVVEGIGRRVGLVVDEVIAGQQVVVKRLSENLEGARFVSGAAVLPNGRIGLILDVDAIARAEAQLGPAANADAVPPLTAAADVTRPAALQR